MDFNSITQAITTLGFPIAVCLICFWYINKTQEQNKKEVSEIIAEHKLESDKLTNAVNNNTIVMERLITKFTGGSTDDLRG